MLPHCNCECLCCTTAQELAAFAFKGVIRWDIPPDESTCSTRRPLHVKSAAPRPGDLVRDLDTTITFVFATLISRQLVMSIAQMLCSSCCGYKFSDEFSVFRFSSSFWTVLMFSTFDLCLLLHVIRLAGWLKRCKLSVWGPSGAVWRP